MPPRRAAASGPTTALERFVVGSGPPPDPTTVVWHSLEGVAYTAAGHDDAERSRWREGYLDLVRRHLLTRSLVAQLVRAWHDVGIETVLLKGFYLAEAVYASPAERPYTDVDVLIPEAAGERARSVAVGLGWSVAASRLGPVSSNPYSHMELVLERDGVSVDVHRFVIHNSSTDTRMARRYTAAAWEQSRSVEWAGTVVRHLDPRDCALTGLLVARAWSIDRWYLKVTDYRDLVALAERQGLQRESLVERATELGCTRTAEIMLARCDPWRGHLDLGAPTNVERLLWATRTWSERSGTRRRLFSVRRRGVSVSSLLEALPAVVLAQRAASTYVDPDALVSAVAAAAPRQRPPLAPHERVALFAAIRLLVPMVQLSGDRCVVRSVALYQALRAHGDDVELWLGLGGETPTPRRHAWVRYADPALPHAETWPACPVRVVTHVHSEQRTVGVGATPMPPASS